MCRKMLAVIAAAVGALMLLADQASARMGGYGGRGGGFGGVRAGSFGAMRMSGFGGPARIGGFADVRSVGFARSYAAPMAGYRVGAIGWRGDPGWVARRIAWGGYGRGRYGWRQGWGWGAGYHLAVGLGYGATAGYDDSCSWWDGWEWVNVCYDSAIRSYGGSAYGYPSQY